jgi:hypothetical protein
MTQSRITAAVISCPGQLGNATFKALQLNVEGFDSPYVLTLAMRAIGYKALAEQADPDAVFEELATAVNTARISIDLSMAPSQTK